ncbi:hypothetical protein LSTR_LSTR014097 [Laodelphax striatellus]|uniref:Uncharacterized protein n=1 Tax=Laodelphax striatellus TaxID=195883 RepID=A0A482WKS3_LAOST|nr:hypothetical protein LSTR_LSTR014097 [Laodelphax striatellus]
MNGLSRSLLSNGKERDPEPKSRSIARVHSLIIHAPAVEKPPLPPSVLRNMLPRKKPKSQPEKGRESTQAAIASSSSGTSLLDNIACQQRVASIHQDLLQDDTPPASH